MKKLFLLKMTGIYFFIYFISNSDVWLGTSKTHHFEINKKLVKVQTDRVKGKQV